ncbi:hypothetical protein KM043_002405 [Ampulex compressa]|nr:hypothetical protein KM043_002405 [Ampulex compressa]
MARILEDRESWAGLVRWLLSCGACTPEARNFPSKLLLRLLSSQNRIQCLAIARNPHSEKNLDDCREEEKRQEPQWGRSLLAAQDRTMLALGGIQPAQIPDKTLNAGPIQGVSPFLPSIRDSSTACAYRTSWKCRIGDLRRDSRAFPCP